MNIMDSDIFYDRYIAEDFETKYVPKFLRCVQAVPHQKKP